MSVPVTIVGNLTADVELKFTPQGKAVSKFSVATSERFKNEKGEWDSKNTTFWNIIVWDKQAENVADTIGKGDEVIIFGKAYTTSWQDKNTGETRSRIEVTATKVAVVLNRVSAKLTKVAFNSGGGVSADTWNSTPVNDPWRTTPVEDTPPF
jgi:single-strand DNA-binding protein